MKKYILSLLLVFGLLAATAQDKYDEVLLTSGVEYQGKVLEINDKEIKFSHKGESLVYSIARSSIFRIQFASGRTEIMTAIEKEGDKAAVVTETKVDRNMVAVLPFRFVSNKGFGAWEEMSYNIQREAYAQAVGGGSRYSFQSPQVTNAILLRRGINPQQLRAYSMDELCSILGVGFIMTGEVSMRSTGYVATGSQQTIQTNRPGYNKPGTTTTSTVTVQNNRWNETYNTVVNLHVYNQQGGTIFNRSKESVWSTPDAYKITLNYLLKRTPL